MLLSDPRLKFARDLIGHWTQIRRGALVPLEEDIDPRELVRLLPFMTIADLSEPEAVTIELVGTAVTRRYGTDIRKANWIELIPRELRRPAAIARGLLSDVPCGVYYKFKASAGGRPQSRGETVGLPLRTRGSERPNTSISLTRDLPSGSAVHPPSAGPRKVDEFFAEFVDIGAGAPGNFPTEPQ